MDAHSTNSARGDTQLGGRQTTPPWIVNIQGRNKWFCPVPGCPKADSARSHGYISLKNLRVYHLKEHPGRVPGAVPTEFLEQNNLRSCPICGKIGDVKRHRVCCPSCGPEFRAATNTTPLDATAIEGLPSLDDIYTTRVRLFKHIPKQARASWGEALAKATARVVHLNTNRAWTELLMLPKCVLLTPPRQGKSNKRTSAAFVKHRCERWLLGDRMELWTDGPAARQNRRSPRPSDPSDPNEKEHRQRRCFEKVADGQYAKGAKALISSPPLNRDEQTEKALRDKHPKAQQAPNLDDLAAPVRDDVPELDSTLVKRMIKSFPRGSGAGPTGLRAQHLLNAITSDHGDEAIGQLTSLCNLLARGEAPSNLAAYLGGASLMALEKPGGGVRPIAIGEVLRRLVAKCLCKLHEGEAYSYLWPRQIGVAAPLGAEVGSHTVRQWYERHRDTTGNLIFVADFENAFNTVDREVFLREARHRMPGLSRWVEWCYSSPSNLFFDGTIIPSEVGVQQGDPIGPLLFALALQPVIEQLGNIQGLDLAFSFLDDLVLAGKQEAVALGINQLQNSAGALGLKLNRSKCELIPASENGKDINWELFNNDIQRNLNGGFTLLGAPIGKAEYCQSITAKRADKIQRCFDAIGELHDPQVALALLRSCASFGKMVFAARTTPFDIHQQPLLLFDKAVRKCFESFTGLCPDDTQWLQATLATKKGGLGLRSASRHSAPAYLSSRSGCHQLCKQLDPDHVWEVNEESSAAHKAVKMVNHLAGSEVVPPDRVPPDLKQRVLSSHVDEGILAELTHPSKPLDFRAHLKLLQMEGANSWIHATPNPAVGTKVSPQLFIPMVQRHLRIPFHSKAEYCPRCTTVMDIYGDHALTCMVGGDRTKRHNMIRNVVVRLATSAGWRPEPEKTDLLRSVSTVGGDISTSGEEARPEARRPADIFVPRWDLGGSAALDFAVTSGLRTDVLEQTASQGGLPCLTAYEDYKSSYLNTSQICAENGITFVPMIIEAHSGGWGPAATKVWSRLSRAISLVSGEPAAVEALRLKQNLGLTLQRETARAILRRFPLQNASQDREAARALLDSENTLWEEKDEVPMEY